MSATNCCRLMSAMRTLLSNYSVTVPSNQLQILCCLVAETLAFITFFQKEFGDTHDPPDDTQTIPEGLLRLHLRLAAFRPWLQHDKILR